MIEGIDWDRIEGFIGYGRIDAPVVFIGLEEGLAKPSKPEPCLQEELLDQDLRARSRFRHDVMDVEEAHRDLYDGPQLFSERPRKQPSWRVMADLMLARKGIQFSNKAERRILRQSYRVNVLGRKNGDTLLIELLPYPHPKNIDWLYSKFGRFNSRAIYEYALIPRRTKLLRAVIEAHPREAIVCYGKGLRAVEGYANWNRYKLLLPKSQWRKIGPFEVGDQKAARIVLTDHFCTKAFNSNDQLDELARTILTGALG